MAVTSSSLRPSLGRVLNLASKPTTPVTTLPIAAPKCSFSTSAPLGERQVRRDNNRLRGLSSMYRSGPRARMNVTVEDMPQPAFWQPEVKVDPNHGLYQFFYGKDKDGKQKVMQTPEEDFEHGRGWSVEEARHKSWDDLHALYWVCVKELNRIATASRDRRRQGLHGGKDESESRRIEVRRTMKSIRHALTERHYAWEDARKLAEEDPEVDLNSTRNPYTPADRGYYDDVPLTEPTENYVEGGAEGAGEQADGARAESKEDGSETIKADESDPKQNSEKARAEAPETVRV